MRSMGSDEPAPPAAVEFLIQVCSPTGSNQVAPHISSGEARSNEQVIRRNQRCWDFPNWRLHRAAASPNYYGGLKEMMKQLHQLGADVHSKDSKGRTALHEAAKAGNFASAGYLLSLGADLDAPDENGSTPLVEAVRFRHQDLASFLIAERRRLDDAKHSSQLPLLPAPPIVIDHHHSPRWRRRRDMLEWFLILLNVVVELCQAVVSEEAGEGKLGGQLYRGLTLGFSSICLVLSVVEVAKEATKNGQAKWRKIRFRWWCCCFYYPRIQYCWMFGRFTMWFGLAISTLQFGLNAMALVAKRAVVKFDYFGLLLAVCLLLASLIDGEDATNKMDGDRECEPGLGWFDKADLSLARHYSNPLA